MRVHLHEVLLPLSEAPTRAQLSAQLPLHAAQDVKITFGAV
jgi:hypothetical protein